MDTVGSSDSAMQLTSYGGGRRRNEKSRSLRVRLREPGRFVSYLWN